MTTVQFYPLEISYKIVGEKPAINLFGRTTDGTLICVAEKSFAPYFWVLGKGNETEISEKIKGLRLEADDGIVKAEELETRKKSFLGTDVQAIRVSVNKPSDVPVLRDAINQFAECVEADIPYTRRYLIDKGIIPLTLCEAEGKEVVQKGRAAYFEADHVRALDGELIKKLNILSFDIETHNPGGKEVLTDENPILMIGFSGENFKKVITWKKFQTKKECIEFVEGEAQLIQRFKEIVEEQAPDILVGYYSDGFDLPYIRARADKFKIKLDIGLDSSEIKFSKKKTAEITGITHLDLFQFIIKIFGRTMDTSTYDLNSISKELLDEEKDRVDINGLAAAWENNHELEKYCDYNLKDAELTYKLSIKLMPQIIEMTKLIGLPIFELTRLSFSQLVEWYLIRRAPEFNQLAPNRPGYTQISERRMQTYEGAFVYEPEPGLYKDIIVFDFRSLYPSIISAHNISPDTLNCSCCRDEAEFTPEEKKNWFCKKKKGFVASVIQDVITRRIRVKEIIKASKEDPKLLKAREQALKLVANSMYGYLGFFGARWYSIKCARSITAYGRYYIKDVIEKAKNSGFKVLYSDTDSIFLALGSNTKEKVDSFIISINQELPELMELEYEGHYPAGIFVGTKETGYGAKKKYALISESGSIKIKGFETVRRNLSYIAKKTQEETLRIILQENDIKKAKEYVIEVIRKIIKKEVPVALMVIQTQLQKEVGNYDSVGPHVAAALRMKLQGKKVGPGSMIKYVIVQGKERIRDRARLPEEVKENEYDSDYYIDHQIIPVVEKILEVVGCKKEDLIKKEQSKLDSYFGG